MKHTKLTAIIFIILFFYTSLFSYQSSVLFSENNEIIGKSFTDNFKDFKINLKKMNNTSVTNIEVILNSFNKDLNLASYSITIPDDLYIIMVPSFLSDIKNKNDFSYQNIILQLCMYFSYGYFLKASGTNDNNGNFNIFISMDENMTKEFSEVYKKVLAKNKKNPYNYALQTVINKNKKEIEKNLSTILLPISKGQPKIEKFILRMILHHTF